MASTPSPHGPRMKGLALVILTCAFLSLVELPGKNVKVLEISMRKHKAFCSCAQKIIYKVTIDICSRIFAKITAVRQAWDGHTPNCLGWPDAGALLSCQGSCAVVGRPPPELHGGSAPALGYHLDLLGPACGRTCSGPTGWRSLHTGFP